MEDPEEQPTGSQVLAPSESLEIVEEQSPQPTPDGFTGDAFAQGQGQGEREALASSHALRNPRKRKNASCCMVGLRKLWILLWKNFLLRKRSWVLLIFHVLSLIAIFYFTIQFGPPSGTNDFIGPIPAKETEHKDIIGSFLTAVNYSKILFAPNTAEERAIIDHADTKLLRHPAASTITPPEWIPATSKTDVEKKFNEAYANRQQGTKRIWGAIIFEQVNAADGVVKYTIRKSDEDVFAGFQAPFHTEQLFSPHDSVGTGPGLQSYMDHYNKAGILGLQLLIDDAAMKTVFGEPVAPVEPEITLKSFPYPKYQPTDDGKTMLGVLLVLVFLMANAFLAKGIGSEKETGVRELMKLCGYPGWMQSFAWYLIAFLVDLILLGVFLLLLKTIDAGKGAHARPYFQNSDFLLLLFVFLLGMISNNAFIFFLSSLTKSTALATAGSIILPVAIIIGSYALDVTKSKLAPIIGMSFLPHGSFIFALNIINAYEGDGRGAQWSMIDDRIPNLPELSFGLMILMLFVDIILYHSLSVYLEAVLPSEYGIRKPLHYPILALIAAVKPRKRGLKGALQSESKAGAFEPTSGIDKPVGVEIRSLVKKFGAGKTAVNGVSLKMFDGEIFALLGHNGAGKTTLISMLSGLFAPTSGTAIVCGYDIRTDLDKVRQSLGLCPQHDMLFNNLTVMEHLQIFGQMKGQKSCEVKQEALVLLQMMNLAEKRNVVSRKLSGGQKRKLCLGMALIGGAKVVILDEPTSGMDPEARRAIWDILLQVRGQRTILLTTHFMEEADALGERIGIMAAGQLQCCGSPAFLKSFYGTGYTLKMSLLPGANKAAILSLVQKHISTATMKPINMPNEVFISLPTDATGSSALTSMFSALSAKKAEMHIESIGLSVASMDEIFVIVGELSENAAVALEAKEAQQHPQKSKSTIRTHSQKGDDNGALSQVPGISQVPTASHGELKSVTSASTSAPPRKKNRGISLIMAHMLALICKRLIIVKRKPFLLLFQIVIPSALMLCAVLVVNDELDPGTLPPALKMRFKDYQNSLTYYSDAGNPIPDGIKAVVGSEAKSVPDINVTVTEAGENKVLFFRQKIIAAGEVLAGDKYTAWYNPVPMHASPLAINLASNIRAKKLNPDFTIQMTNHPLRTQGSLNMQVAQKMDGGHASFVFSFISLVLMALFLVSLFFVILPTEERLNKSRQLQLMTGCHPLTYWGIYFLWDVLVFGIVATMMILIALIFQHYSIFSTHYGLGVIFLVILCYGFAMIPLSYVVSGISKSVAGGVILLFFILFIPLLVAFFLTRAEATLSFAYFLHDIAPAAGARYAFANIAVILQRNAKCNFLGEDERTAICHSTSTDPKLKSLQACCKRGECRALGVRCFQPVPYLTWTYREAVGPVFPGVGQLLFGMFAVSFICLILHVSIELGIGRWIRSLLLARSTNISDFLEPVDDEDVRVEAERVAEIIATGSKSEDALVVDTLCKNFGGFSAVSRLTFGVHHGECFGLLGTNGAGKTTTFRMLTGEETPSLGEVFLDRFSLRRDRRSLISHVGYCPQFDAVVPYFTGKENLLLFGRLRGIPWGRVSGEADRLLESVGLTSSQHVQSRRYSGGMRRRLSAAVAIIGDPALVLLDEPTSGVDPVSRRQFWKVLESVKAGGQSIILTSHSMDECEALCARLGIMVNGQLQCIGGVQHLKHKFAQGYTLTLRLKTTADPKKQEYVGGLIEALNNEITQKFHPCVLKDQHETVMQYQIENASLDWNVIYKNLEDLKRSYGDIVEDYSVSETSLEEVFLAFSRKQYPPRDNKIPMWKRVLTCQY